MDFHLYQSLESRDLYHCTYLLPKRQSSSRFECSSVKNVSLASASGAWWQRLETEEELLPSGHQAPKLKLSLINIKKQNKKKAICTSLSALLFIVLFIKSHILFLHILQVCTFLYSTAHFTFYFFFYLYICSCVVLLLYNFFILCPVHWADLIWPTFHFWL